MRVFNHNVVLVEEPVTKSEVVLLGKGIGFGRKPGEKIVTDDPRLEKRFRLENETNKRQYQTVIDRLDHSVIGIAEEIIALITREITPQINEHIHVALPDHIQFAIYRLRNGLEIVNPFLFEIQTLHAQEFALAKRAAEMIKQSFDIDVPESEIGFLALHIHSAVSYVPITKTVQFTNLIGELVQMIEAKSQQPIQRNSVDYVRLITHLRFALDRIREGKPIVNPLLERIKLTLPEQYELAVQLASHIAERLETTLPDDEVGYLAMHLFRLVQLPYREKENE
ncbi:glucose PTS transporter transcription antiterminator GlcT [Brevibacillus fulvus]|uniref:glucose PTS transporter transcription antiterminator GlcT n=1 Tax=Brevibacillus fulvus TaxID=1125967 RepID=UPI0030840318